MAGIVAAFAAAAVGMSAAVLIVTVPGIPDMTVFGMIVFVVVGVPLAVAAVLSGAWGQLALARLALAVCRRTPLRLMGFLAEAHDRGVLRQAGGIYQFRHNLLQDHLAAPIASAAPAAP